ncbi:PQQ-binding-like beta-propeller repeat protein [Mucilaginibacter sp. 14171R-50]|uniref:outer membrane protein assembly factor BamB family protein n=1 Tax=Mucilaginibacter sp. 14171R-50 TaxID=2703789 RepID=UPI00138BAF23|nr:PQQ-binding-like beta-propeller repeat protein [Mucilaginibacter sp. 14171R-50]QHS56911.1 PQQ-binding-like beta-propeller repeat protein [Mucilaginibacter sp. 14171R-50]
MKKIIGLPFAAAVFVLLYGCNQKKDYRSWPQYKGSNENIHYSSLTEVDTTNVSRLQVAWTYHTRDADTINHSQIQCNPIVVDGVLYGTTPKMKLFAIDATTGQEKWQFNPFDSLAKDKKMFFIMNNSRGVAYWANGEDKRIYYSAGPYLYAINAITGKTISSFADKGKLDLHDGLDRDVKDLFVTATSPPIMYRNIMVMGTRVDEGAHAAPGHIRAFDVLTGKQVWIFHTIPHPGEPGFESWEDKNAWKYIGGANAWSGFSLDEKRGIVYGCTGSASYDWYGGKRLGNNLYADCLLALDVKTGKLKWHFQDIHHDVWDRDIPTAPALVTIKKDGKSIDAVAVTTKTGFIFTFDRETGKPVYDIVEKPVPTFTDLKGEKLSPTQPYPTAPAPFMRQLVTEQELNPYMPDSSRKAVLAAFKSYRTNHMFNAPTLGGIVEFPGLDGGGEWGGPSYDPETGILYVNANEMAWAISMLTVDTKGAAGETNLLAGQRLYRSYCMTCHGSDRKGAGTVPSLININRKYNALQFDTLIQSGRRMMPAFRQLKPAERKAIASFVLDIGNEQPKSFIDEFGKNDEYYRLPYAMAGYNKFLSKEGYPGIKPPWGTLNAIDLNTGKFVWKRALGNDPEFPHGKEDSGTENYGASVITKGGLLFIAATKDGKFRAFNKRTGKLLWQVTLPAPGYATPSVYEIDGKQYIVIACGGGKMNTKSGDSYVAFALPSK